MGDFIPKIPPTALPPIPKNPSRFKNLELEDTAKQAARNIKKGSDSRLPEEQLTDLIILLAEGVTYETIIRKFRKRWNRGISCKTIKRYADKYGNRIQEIAREADRVAIETGLSKKTNRVRRLQQLAEALEEQIYDSNGSIIPETPAKVISEYREVMKLLGQEAGDLKGDGQTDIIFADLTNEELIEMTAGKLAGNKDLTVRMTEIAGVRPGMPIEAEKN